MARPGDAEIWDALFEHVSSVDPGREMDFSWPGVAYEPRRDGTGQLVPYFRVDIMPTSAPEGLLQVSVVWHDDDGILAPCRIADRVVEHFALGTALISSGGQRIRVSRTPWTSAPLIGEGEVVVPVRIQWTPYSPL